MRYKYQIIHLMIIIDNLSKSFKRTVALKNLSVQFELGQGVAIIGPNASGKTTLVKCILSMVHSDKGSINFFGKDIKINRDYLSQIGYMPQIGRYPDHIKVGQVFDLMQSIRKKIDNPPLDTELIEQFQLKESWHKAMRTLSGGTRQKVSAALAFLFSPTVLILDEPTAGLDPLATETLKTKIISELKAGKLVLITSHIMSDLEELSSHILYLHEGEKKFFQPIEALQAITGEQRLSKAIAQIMKNHLNQWEKSSSTSYTI